jgi:SAM-dependent methyltransferase
MALNHKLYHKWVAVEPDKSMCLVLKAANANREFGAGFKVINGTSASLCAENTFDTILYVDVLEHIEDDLNELEHIQNYLVEGGHIIIVAPAHNFLYTAFDKKIGHYRRYNKKMLRSLVPNNMVIKQMRYLDSIGLLASLANRLFLKTDTPTRKQIQLWDKFMVRASRLVDIIIRYNAGKSILCVLEKTTIKGRVS